MRPPDTDLIERRRAGLAAWRDNARASLLDLATMFHIEPQSLPLELIPAMTTTFADADVTAWDSSQRAWWWAHSSALVAAVLTASSGGDWEVDMRAASASFGRYVVAIGQAGGGGIVDVGELVQRFLLTPPPRSFVALLADAEAEAERSLA